MAINLDEKANRENRLHNYLSKDFRHMKLKLILLRKISKRPSYSYGLIDDFGKDKASMILTGSTCKELKNDIYNTIKALEKSGYIKPRVKVENGKLKNYYYITSNGKRALKESKTLLTRFVKELSGILV